MLTPRTTKSVFRLLLLLMVASAIIGDAFFFAGTSSLPPEVQDYIRAGAGSPLSRGAMRAAGYVGLVLAAVMVIGLFFFWQPARLLLLLMWALGLMAVSI